MNRLLHYIDWFIPDAARFERSELSLARNFVFTHLAGPLLSQSISLFLFLTDPDPGFACWTVIVCIWLFWLLPFVLKFTRDLQVAALISVELLAFTALFGAFHYGGVSSPFLPWLIVSLLLGFFYLSDRSWLVIGLFACNIGVFLAAYCLWGFPQQVPLSQLTTVGWISILSATVYMSWMAIYYANIMSMRSELERETERHRATAIRLREVKEQADIANRSKSIFLAKMSHELRTPLNAVIGYSEILLENVEPDAGDRSRRADLERINAAGKHLLSLVADVLDLSKIESNSIDLKIERFDLRDLVSDVVTTTQHLAVEKGNVLSLTCIGQLGIVSTDPTKLRQVLLNLIGNAAKFTERGQIALSVRRDMKSGGDWIELQVRDTGIGLDRAQIGRLFQNFAQATPATARTYGGSGLGLAISQKFCALMGGAITVTSEPGRGSCFTVRVLADLSEEGADGAEAATANLATAV
jgi:signal transduction histidine kinase